MHRKYVNNHLVLFSTLLLMGLAVVILSSQNSVFADEEGVSVNSSESIIVDAAHPAKLVNVTINSDGSTSSSEEDITVEQAEAMAEVKNDESDSVYADLSPTSFSPAIVTRRTCHSWQAVKDVANITLTEVRHDTRWDYSGSAVGLVSIGTAAGWHWSTGWSRLSGPSQWVVDGNGGWSDQTHGEARFQWIGGQHNHWLKNDNQVRANGSCQGTLTVTGVVPTISHMARVVYITP